jgi:UDP-N-acetylmuramoyl-tripeptide--D-alanyl-D-alanine ligase
MMLILLEKTAKALIHKYKPIVVCITGSVGKTSVKNAIASTLGEYFTLRKTPKNINNDFGVAISVIGGFKFKEGFWALLRILFIGLKQLIINKFPKVLVIEVGAGKIGEIERVSRWLKPNILVITNLPDKPSHLGVFGSKENIIKEKKFLADVMDNEGVMLIDESENNMNYFLEGFKGKLKKYNSVDFIDHSKYSVLYKKDKEIFNPTGFEFVIGIYNQKQNITFTNFIGKQSIKAILISKIIAEELKCNSDDIVNGIKKYKPEPGRLNILQGKLKNVSIIDDSFNSSPIAVENGLKNLIDLESNVNQRKIAVLGDMLSLGDESDDIHNNTATEYIQKLDILITVGDKSKNWQSFSDNKLGFNRHFKNSTNASNYIKSFWKQGDLIYLKGGHLIRLEKAVKNLTNCSEDDLVRQEQYWQKPEYELFNEKDD